jgi:Ca2+-transporting ATPase
MLRSPRRRNQPLIDRRLLLRAFFWLGPIEAILAFSGFFLVFTIYGQNPAFPLSSSGSGSWQTVLASMSENMANPVYLLAMTIYLVGVVLAQVGNAFAARSETNRSRSLGWFSNRFLLVGTGLEILLIIFLIYYRSLAGLFQHVPLPLVFWLWLALYPVILYNLEWIRKGVVRKLYNNRQRTS